ncbi:MAG: hypothetical protein AB9834_23880 [Lentimicrobium sp.]
MANSITLFIVIAIIAITVFLSLREFTCWYFKINKQIALQQAMLETFLKMYERDGGEVNWESVNKTLLK